MLHDASDIDASTLSADVCVIGAGPAGLTVAAELAAAGIDVVVLEAGGRAYDRHRLGNTLKAVRDHWSGAQSLTRGTGSGEPYYPLRLARARGLAGSTNALLHHGLRARPLDAVDLGPRFGSAWPISHEELGRYLPAAEVYAGIRDAAAERVQWNPQPLRGAGGNSQTVVAAPFRHGTREAFPQHANALADAQRPRLVTSAVVTGFRVAGSGAVRSAQIICRGGRSLTVAADAFVLAAGGIDNPRLLLSSRPVLYAMDAAADQVGRNFMEHLHYVAGYLVPESAEATAEIQALVGDPRRPAHWLTPVDDVVVDEDLLRVAFAALPVHETSLHPAVPAAGELMRIAPYGPYGLGARVRQAATAIKGGHHVVRAAAARARGDERAIFALGVMSEQLPDRDSRVTLGPQRDRTGLPLPALQWGVGLRDFADAHRATELLAAEVETLGWGRVVSLWDRGAHRPDVVTGGWHHMGTTMMSVDPASGVVDEDCRVHGIANLFVAGSSVFATSGYANPTLTLVALAVRLGRHLAANGPTG